MVTGASAMLGEAAVRAGESLHEGLQAFHIHVAARPQAIRPGDPRHRVIEQPVGGVRAPGGHDRSLTAEVFSNPSMGPEIVSRIIGGRQQGDGEVGEKPAYRPPGQLTIRLVPNLPGCCRREGHIDPEDAAKLQVGPQVQGIMRESRDRLGPGPELVPRLGIARDELLGPSGEPHGSPLVMVVFQPEVGERVVHTVAGDVGCREVGVDVHDGNGRSLFVEQPPRRLGRGTHRRQEIGPPCPQLKR